MKNNKKIISFLLAIILIITATFILLPHTIKASGEDFTLDYAIVAKEYKQGIGHVEGNVLIHNLWTYCSIENSRVPGEYNTSYIQNLINGLYVFQNGITNKLITSDTYNIEKRGNQWFVDNQVFGTTNNLLSIVQKSDGEFLDFEKLFADLAIYANNLYSQVNSSKIIKNDYWNGKFTSVDNNIVVFNINAEDLTHDIDQGDYIKSIAKDKIVVINVITNNEENINIESKMQNEGWESWSGNVLWNFGSYHGNINQNCIFSGTILAPMATVNINAGNLIGSVICNTLTHSSEIHKIAFRGFTKSNSETTAVESSSEQNTTISSTIESSSEQITETTRQNETESFKNEETITELETTTIQKTTTSSTEMIKETKAPELEADKEIVESRNIKSSKTPEIAADISIVSVQTGDESFLNWWILFTTISLCCIFWILCAAYLTKKKK